MATLKGILNQQVAVPMNIEAALPAGVPRVSSVLSSLIQAAPDVSVPDIPAAQALADIPGQIRLPNLSSLGIGAPFQFGLGVGAPAPLSSFPDLVRGVESALPIQVPSIANALAGITGGAPSGAPGNAKAPASSAPAAQGGGWRPIGGSGKAARIMGGGFRSI